MRALRCSVLGNTFSVEFLTKYLVYVCSRLCLLKNHEVYFATSTKQTEIKITTDVFSRKIFVHVSELSKDQLGQAQTRRETKNASPNPAETRKQFEVVNGPEKARKFVTYKCKIMFNFSFINPTFWSIAMQTTVVYTE